MGITTWGWGSYGAVISTWGWGNKPSSALPTLIAQYLGDSSAYTCVVSRSYVEILTRDKSEVVLRVKPDQLSERTYSALVERSKTDAVVRSAGWPRQTGEICD